MNTIPTNQIATAVSQYFSASRSQDKVTAMVDCFSETCVVQDPADRAAMYGKEVLRNYFDQVVQQFSALGLTEEYVAINGNQAAVKWVGQGTTFSGKPITFEGIDIFEIDLEGKIQQLTGFWNPEALLASLQAESLDP
ncbi:nuclear transport factor 2 family protein [Lyngbya confervoides]|uniref:Nuclear transport factor 2 family protein n=1 Tax=Lyngbya confervoides BDU141951 TaxID=1574623 RepID=A0ABD4T4A8_9CYAN|nr:nuclear transport factor 2 family protein [Lyngbya confervoides]MCM1983661.1 nuclear transport factor 2 family protein [Lyngbya confervoides BDU141951]